MSRGAPPDPWSVAPPPSGWGLPDAEWTAPTIADAPEPDVFATPEADRYPSGGLLGQGGMGTVEAVHDQRLGREVARKRSGHHVDAHVGAASLAHEARVLARLDHPNIVPIHDAGRDASGAPWFTMRLVRGQTLADALRAPRQPADWPRLLRHLLDAARALAHAHERGVVHADLKPSNLLLGPHGETQVADWGLAHLLHPNAPRPPAGVGAGTPPWRAPEVEGGLSPGPAADVYALGVILRELLSGDPQRAPEAAPVDLLAVLRRATALDPVERYRDCGLFADDLARWLDGRPVLAHAYTPAELLARLVRAWRVPLAVAGAAFVMIVLILALSAVRLASERDRALAAEADARATASRLWADRAVAAFVREDRPEAERAATAALALGPSPAAAGVLAAYPAPWPAVRIDQRPLPACPLGLRFAPDAIACLDREALHLLDPGGGITNTWPIAATDAVWHGDGWRLLTEARAERLNPDTGERAVLHPSISRHGLVAGAPGAVVDRVQLHLLADPPQTVSPCPQAENLDTAVFGPDGRWWAICSGGQALVGEPTGAWRPLGPERPALQRVVALARDGDRLIAGTLSGELITLDADSGAILHQVQPGLAAIRRVLVAPAGGRALVLDEAGAAWLGAPAVGLGEGRLPVTGVREAAWDGPDRLVLATEALELWAVPPAQRAVWRESGGISALAVSPDGKRLAVAVGPRLLVRQAADGARLWQSDLHERVIKGVVWSPDGAGLASGAVDEDPALAWADPASGAHDREPTSSIRIRQLAGDGSGRVYASIWAPRLGVADTFGGPMRWIGQATAYAQVLGRRDQPGFVAVDEAGRVWVGGPEGSAAPWAPAGAPVRQLALSADGRRMAGLVEGGVRLWTWPEGALVAAWALAGEPTALALSADGSALAVGFLDGQVTAWDDQGGQRWAAPGHTERVSALVAVQGGGWFSAGWDGRVRRWASEAPVGPSGR